MRAISLTQPWATLIALGAKRLETRSWSTPYHGPLAIHAAKGLGEYSLADLIALCRRPIFQRALALGGYAHFEALPRGGIVAVGQLSHCVIMSDSDIPASLYPRFARRAEQERAFGCYAPGRWAWVIDNVRALADPIPARGQLALWEWTPPANLLDLLHVSRETPEPTP